MNQNSFHLTFVVVFTAFTLIRMVYHAKAARARGPAEYKEGKVNEAIRKGVGIPFMLVMFAYMFNPEILSWAKFALPEWAQWLGAALGIASIPLMWWVQWALGANFATTLHVRAEHTLVTHGPYRWVRHPMYSVLYLLEIAILLLTANWFIGGVLLIGQSIVLWVRINNEENAMLEKFGDSYRAYMYTTPRFVPGLF